MASLTPSPKMQFLDANGNPLVGGKLYTYAAGTTTPLATYTDAGGGTPNTNPVILDSRGEANVWLGSALYKLTLKDANDVLIWTADNVGGVATLTTLAASGGAALIGYLPSGTGAVATTVQAKLRETISSSDFPNIQTAVDSLSAGDTLIIQPGSYTEYDIDISTSEIIIENYGDFTLPANARESIFKIAEGVSDVTFRNYGVLDGNRFNQGNCNTIPLGTGILEVSNDLASNYTYRIRVENYGTFKDGANNGIYVHRKVSDFTLDPAGYFVGHRNDGVASSSTNYRFKIANGYFSQCGHNGQAIASCADYTIIDRITVKNPAVADDGVTLGGNIGITLGHSGTPPETSFYSEITNCQIIDIGDSASGILLKAGLSDNSIIANNTLVRTTGETSGGIAIRLIGGVANTSGMMISNNTVIGPWSYGIMNWDYTSTGYSISQVLVEGNYISITGNNAETFYFTSGAKHTFVGNHVENNGTTSSGIRLSSSDCVIANNRFIATSVGVKVNACPNLVCTSNAITASSVANCIVLDQIDSGVVIGLNNKNGQIQSGVPIVTGKNTAAVSNPVLGAIDSGGVTSYLVTLNNEVSGKTSSTYQGGLYFVTNITDNTHAVFAYTSLTLSAGFTILASTGANWSTTYNAATKEGIALNASGDGPILFSNLGASKNYRVVCFGGS